MDQSLAIVSYIAQLTIFLMTIIYRSTESGYLAVLYPMYIILLEKLEIKSTLKFDEKSIAMHR